MADGTDNPDKVQDEPVAESGAEPAREVAVPRLKQLWQAPLLVLGVLVLGLGVYLALPEAEEDQFGLVMEGVASLLAKGDVDRAELVVRETLEPYIDQASV